MLFEYNSTPVIDSAAINLADHAKGLLHRLSLNREVGFRSAGGCFFAYTMLGLSKSTAGVHLPQSWVGLL